MRLLMLSKEVEKFLFSLAAKQFKQVTVSMLKLLVTRCARSAAEARAGRKKTPPKRGFSHSGLLKQPGCWKLACL